MAGGGFVEGRSYDFGVDGARHVCHFLRSFVDEEHHEISVGIVGGNGVGNLFHQDRLTRFGLRHDECALTFTDGGEQIDDAAGQRRVASVRQFELFIGKERGEMFERHAVAHLSGIETVDAVDAHQREILFSFARHFDFAFHHVAHFQCVAADLILGDKHIVGRRHIIIVRRAEKTNALRVDFKHAAGLDEEVLLFGHRRRGRHLAFGARLELLLHENIVLETMEFRHRVLFRGHVGRCGSRVGLAFCEVVVVEVDHRHIFHDDEVRAVGRLSVVRRRRTRRFGACRILFAGSGCFAAEPEVFGER